MPATIPAVPPDDVVNPPTRIRVLWYDQDHCEEKESDDVCICKAFSARAGTTWIDVTGVSDSTVLQELGRTYRLHPLALEDVQNLRERPKVETYEGQKFVVFRLVRLGDAVTVEQISAFLVVRPITCRRTPLIPGRPYADPFGGGWESIRGATISTLIDAIDAVFPSSRTGT